ncbi:ommochrome-binding protein-like [Aricia agestis]|uniref:ommochrome-binding protein-like n=1 Tax=Aricia agestis TaxID=91739 RepID=UPI001C2042E4|nr:ommochrome-binding protein-like [Aricia agestis]
MYFFLALFFMCLTTPLLAHDNNTKCEEIEVRGVPHRKIVLGKGINRPYQLAYDQKDHKVFYSYNTGEDDEDSFAIGYIEKNHTRHNGTEEVENGFAVAINHKDNIIYFGGSGGVYEHHLNKKDSKIENIDKTHNVWDMFFKKHLYFINFPFQHLYKYDHEKKKFQRQRHIHEKIYQFAIDGDDDVFLTNETGLYIIKNGTDHRNYIEGPKVYRAIEINNKGEAYFSGQNGIYVAHKHNNTLHKIAHVKNIFGITFDHDDHIIYSDPHEIVKLLPEKC